MHFKVIDKEECRVVSEGIITAKFTREFSDYKEKVAGHRNKSSLM